MSKLLLCVLSLFLFEYIIGSQLTFPALERIQDVKGDTRAVKFDSPGARGLNYSDSGVWAAVAAPTPFS